MSYDEEDGLLADDDEELLDPLDDPGEFEPDDYEEEDPDKDH